MTYRQPLFAADLRDGRPFHVRVAERMDADALVTDHPLRVAHAALVAAIESECSANAPGFIKAWVEARVAWCDYTGEPLI